MKIFNIILILLITTLSVYVMYLRINNIKLTSELDILNKEYTLSETENKKLKLIIDENNKSFQNTIDGLNTQIKSEREISNQLISQYRNKLNILKNAKSVNPKDTTGVIDQNSSKEFIEKTNTLIDNFNKSSESNKRKF